MKTELNQIRTEILLSALPHVEDMGWSKEAVDCGLKSIDKPRQVFDAAFPDGVAQLVCFFSEWADDEMLEILEKTDIEPMRIRDRIRTAVLTRLDVLNPYKACVRQSVSYWIKPARGLGGQKSVWKSADKMWLWAGDTAQDYNKYSKRFLLSAVIVSTTMAWLSDDNPDLIQTKKFLDRRIDNVLKLGKAIHQMKERLSIFG